MMAAMNRRRYFINYILKIGGAEMMMVKINIIVGLITYKMKKSNL
jgi:hypothetical protein